MAVLQFTRCTVADNKDAEVKWEEFSLASKETQAVSYTAPYTQNSAPYVGHAIFLLAVSECLEDVEYK